MQIGMIGLGRMGSNMVRRLMRAGHSLVVFDRSSNAVHSLVTEGATGATSLADFAKRLSTPRVLCVMVPVGAVDALLDELVPLLGPQDVVIDGGNSLFQDDIARHARLTPHGIRYVDMGTSGGVWGLERGFCLMIGGDEDVVARLDPMFAALSPGADASRIAFSATEGFLLSHAGGGKPLSTILGLSPSDEIQLARSAAVLVTCGILALAQPGADADAPVYDTLPPGMRSADKRAAETQIANKNLAIIMKRFDKMKEIRHYLMLARGQLVRVTRESWRAPWSYFLAAPPAHFRRPVVRAFVDWALAEARDDGGPP